jgi:uncharacterized protein (DUF1330 family)
VTDTRKEPRHEVLFHRRIDFTDRAWVPDYVAKVTAMIGRHGGRYLARTGNFQRIEASASRRKLLVLIEWPSRDAATAFYPRGVRLLSRGAPGWLARADVPRTRRDVARPTWTACRS